ncbi:ribosome recycling factor [Patescibacteria group bacterium]|nr:ribosome recycling factor [Patescibacteria group bacterium]MBU1705765.1 ribosome recycling factor [Patescibacteria group bacterium]
MHPFIQEKLSNFEAVLEHLNKGLGALRTGRATPTLVEDVVVNAYNSNMDLKSVASIRTQDAKTLVIEPWDKGLIQAIEKAIRDADLGFSPTVDGSLVRINLPPMTEENRKQLVKIMRERAEEARVGLRGVREVAREEIMKMEKAKEVSEDEKYKMLDELDKTTKDFTSRADETADKKEAEIMTV